ncbi:MAG: PH domain-containing protein [Actinomycetota bacterium]|nr:PH domain-containing protein [Actinomycetota bacterium]
MPPRPRPNPRTFRPAAARVLSIAWFALAVVLAADILVRGEGKAARVTLGAVALITVVVYGVAFRPAVEVDDDGVTLRNVVRDVTVPWSRVTDISARWALGVHTADARFDSWAVTGRGRTEQEKRSETAARSGERDRRHVDFAGFVVAQVLRRWQERPPGCGDGEIERRWAVDFLGPLVVIAVLVGLAGFLP